MSRAGYNFDSFKILSEFFDDLFRFIKSLQFDQNDARNIFTIILSNCSTLCSYYFEILISLASKRFLKKQKIWNFYIMEWICLWSSIAFETNCCDNKYNCRYSLKNSKTEKIVMNQLKKIKNSKIIKTNQFL